MVINQDFKQFLQALNENNVTYLVIGGYADAFHGHPRSFHRFAESEKNKKATGRLQDVADLENLE